MKWLRRNAWRLLIALGAAALALGYVPESRPELGSILPRLSPILSLFGALAARADAYPGKPAPLRPGGTRSPACSGGVGDSAASE